MVTLPALMGTMTRLGMVSPAVKLSLLAVCTGWPKGNTERKPAAVGLVTVTFRMTADAVDGIPAVPGMSTLNDWLAWSLAAGAPVPSRVSSIRVGVTGLSPAPLLGA